MKIACLNKILFFIILSVSVSAQSGKYSDYIHQKALELKNRKSWNPEIYSRIKAYKAFTIGEMHGTEDVPEFTKGLVNLLVKNDKKVLLCLELPEEDNEALAAAKEAGEGNLVKSLGFFNSDIKDGRSSIAMAGLIKEYADESSVKLYFFDPGTDSKNRDSLMAENILSKLKENKDYIPVILAGNLHSKLSKGTSKDSAYKPMAYYLYKIPESPISKSDILALNFFYKSGTAWNCTTDCGIHPLQSEESIFSASTDYDYYLLLTDNYYAYFGYTGFLFSKNPVASKPLKE
jgi:hypothetical protein